MCARYSLTRPDGAIAELFGVAEAPNFSARWNIAPTQTAPVVIEGPRGVRRVAFRRWGLVPPWASDLSIGVRMINARAETAATKPSFRSALRSRRCLVPADAFYEWRTEGRAKLPVRFGMRDGSPFAFAGIWERWGKDDDDSDDGAGARAVETFAILTTTPNTLVATVHDRMPLILPRESFAAWLDPDAKDAAALEPLLRPFPADGMTATPLSPFVNNVRNEGPGCWQAADRGLFGASPDAGGGGA